jgi:hypothetical protein
MFCCDNCGTEVIRSYGDHHKIKMRTNIVIWDLETGICIAKCQKCKSEVRVPLMLRLPDDRVIGENEKNEKNGRKRKKA